MELYLSPLALVVIGLFVIAVVSLLSWALVAGGTRKSPQEQRDADKEQLACLAAQRNARLQMQSKNRN